VGDALCRGDVISCRFDLFIFMSASNTPSNAFSSNKVVKVINRSNAIETRFSIFVIDLPVFAFLNTTSTLSKAATTTDQ